MDRITRQFLRALALVAVFAGTCVSASAANEPYNINVSYEPAVPRATVSWTADATPTSFDIERRPVGRTPWNKIKYLTDGAARSWVDTTVAPLTRYEYRVVAYRADGVTAGHTSTSTAFIKLNFPYQRPYPNGIRPNGTGRSQAEMDVKTHDMYLRWRAKYLTETGGCTGCARVYKPEENSESVSEGIGYGMLISVFMANDNNSGKSDFDKLLKYYKWKLDALSDGTPINLMSWRVQAGGTVNDIDKYVAPDGDIDVAFALLVADKKWGSGYNGNPNYWSEAQAILNALQAYTVYNRGTGPSNLVSNAERLPGVVEDANSYTMSSYQIPSYMRQFAGAGGSAWLNSLRAAYKAFDYFMDKNPTTGLTPFTFLTKPGTSQYGVSAKGYNYGADSSRVTWRVGLDYLWYGNYNSNWVSQNEAGVSPTLAQDLPKKNVEWYLAKVNNNPIRAAYAYALNGDVADSLSYGQRHKAASMAVGAMTHTDSQARLNLLYDWLAAQTPGARFESEGLAVTPEYFSDTVMMLGMIVVSGNMPNLPAQPIPAQ